MKLSNHIEALLFLSGEPMNFGRLKEILGKKDEEIIRALNELEESLKERGVRLVRNGEEVMLGSAPESSLYCRTLIKEEFDRTLGRAGLEALAIILYKDGVPKTEIDYIRGVNSGFTLRRLMIRGLVKREINPQDKRTHIYRPTTQLFQELGIIKKEDLPDYEKFSKQIEDAEKYSQTD